MQPTFVLINQERLMFFIIFWQES